MSEPVPNEIEVRRSARRRRTVSAYRDGERIVVLIPARFSRSEERRWSTRWSSGSPPANSANAAAAPAQRWRAGQALPRAVHPLPRWAKRRRPACAGSTQCEQGGRRARRPTARSGYPRGYVTCPLGARLRPRPRAGHLRIPGHGPDFWRLVERYPRTERARGYLDGISAAAHLPVADDLTDDVGELYSDDEVS